MELREIEMNEDEWQLLMIIKGVCKCDIDSFHLFKSFNISTFKFLYLKH